MVSEVRFTNPIVGNMLDNAKKAMGLMTTSNGTAMGLVMTANETMEMPKYDEDYDNDDEDVVNDEDFVEEILKD